MQSAFFNKLSSPAQIVLCCFERFAVLGIKLTEPNPELFDELVFLWKERIVVELFMIPHHYISCHVDAFGDNRKFNEQGEKSWSIEVM